MFFRFNLRRTFPCHFRRLACILGCVALLLGCVFGQGNASISNPAVPNLVKFTGTVSATSAGTVGVIFALYQDQTGGAPLWQEVQNVAVDSSGHYTSLLGSSTAAGIPLDVFSSNEARWLGVQVQGQAEQARVLLVSVPYALKAADAQTLGGLPASAFLRADAVAVTTSSVNSAAVNNAVRQAVANATQSLTPVDDAGWNAGSLPMFDSNGNLANSALSQVVTPTTTYLGFGTSAPQFNLHFVATVDPAAIVIDGYGHVGINFIGRRADGTMANPTAVVAGDNLFSMNGRGWLQSANPTVTPTGFSTTSRANLKIFAAEPAGWTDTAEGTYITMATTQIGTINTTEKFRITDAGSVGIGTTTPGGAASTTTPVLLEVNGSVKLTHLSGGGITFQDGTTQITAATTTPGLPTPVVCATGQMLSWNGTGWACATLPSGVTLALTANSGLSASNLASGVLTLGVDTTVQRTLANGCTGNSAISSISQTGAVTCQTVSGGGSVSLPVNWSSSFTPNSSEQGVLNVTNTANGPAEPQSTPPASFVATVPAGVVGTTKGTGITAGVAGFATGTEGLGVFAYTATSSDGALMAWNNITGFTGTNDYPKALSAMLANQTGGSVIKAEAQAATGPAPCSGSGNCQQLTGVDVSMDATSGVTVGLSADMNSPASQGLDLSFNVAPTSGWMINSGVNCNGSTGPCPYFQVDGNANINSSGGLTTNGPSNLNGTVSINNGLNLTGSLNSNGGAWFQNLTISNDLSTANLNANSLTVSNLTVTGTLSKPMGTFKIDHPLDPANKFLYHSFVESPDMMNIYNGNIVTDKHGVATVVLPDYFEALNQDFRYQLTVIGQFAQAIVVKEISKNHFTIKTSKPAVKVSWQVTGIRHDAYAEAHRIQVEEDKGKERGTYLHPELFQKDPVVAQK